MPRKYPGRQAQVGIDLPMASMRPGRMPRKYRGQFVRYAQGGQVASMRPGRMPRKYQRGRGVPTS